MKSLLSTSIFVLALAFSSQAQSLQSTDFSKPVKGDFILGGNLGFNISTTHNFKNSRGMRFLIAPRFGKFVSDKYLITGGLAYSYSNSYYGSSDFNFISDKSNSINLRFGLTRFYPITDKLQFTLEAYLGGGNSFEETINGNSNLVLRTKSGNATLGISPGLTYFLTDRWMINANLGTLNYTLSNIGKPSLTHSLIGNFSPSTFKFGVNYILKGKK